MTEIPGLADKRDECRGHRECTRWTPEEYARHNHSEIVPCVKLCPAFRRSAARERLAWLMWCYQQGYTDPEDRVIITNWMANDPAILTADDVEEREHLLTMADEVLDALAEESADDRDR